MPLHPKELCSSKWFSAINRNPRTAESFHGYGPFEKQKGFSPPKCGALRGSPRREVKPVSRSIVEKDIGARGFEPPTSRSRTVRATRLRYAPILSQKPRVLDRSGIVAGLLQFFQCRAHSSAARLSERGDGLAIIFVSKDVGPGDEDLCAGGNGTPSGFSINAPVDLKEGRRAGGSDEGLCFREARIA